MVKAITSHRVSGNLFLNDTIMVSHPYNGGTTLHPTMVGLPHTSNNSWTTQIPIVMVGSSTHWSCRQLRTLFLAPRCSSGITIQGSLLCPHAPPPIWQVMACLAMSYRHKNLCFHVPPRKPSTGTGGMAMQPACLPVCLQPWQAGTGRQAATIIQGWVLMVTMTTWLQLWLVLQ